MITNREREYRTLNFQRAVDRGAVEETFYPWSLTKDRLVTEGMPVEIANGVKDITNDLAGNKANQTEKYFPTAWGQGVMEFERYLGFDLVRRIHFVLPFRRFEEKNIEDYPGYAIKQDIYGRQVRLDKETGIEVEYKPVIEDADDWQRLKKHAQKELETFFTDQAIKEAYGYIRAGQEAGEYSVRLNIEGFFWVPRELMGITNHLYNFYDAPELMHDINQFVLDVYSTKLMKVLDVISPDLVYIMEDLSGKDGPMISDEMFDEFIGAYYRKLIPLLRGKGVRNVFVDTDGDFNKIIPNFIAAGVDGFLPMDVNAGMDIIKVRKDFPTLKFIGGFNKLCIAEGKEAIEREFQRILPVIRSGGYIVGCDHQVAPSTSLQNYRYYIARLTEIMKQAGADCAKITELLP